MKKLKLLLSVLMITCLLAGCKGMKGYNVYEKLYSLYGTMTSYIAQVDVTSFSNNSENKYAMMLYYKSPDKQRAEYFSDNGTSNVTIINGNNAKLISDFAQTELSLDEETIKEKNYLMPHTFFEIYYSSEETSVETFGSASGGTTKLCAKTGESNPYKNSIEILIDNETLKPIKMTILDFDNKPSLCIEYKEFEFNPELDNNIFN